MAHWFKSEVPGFAIGLVEDNRVVYTAAFGVMTRWVMANMNHVELDGGLAAGNSEKAPA